MFVKLGALLIAIMTLAACGNPQPQHPGAGSPPPSQGGAHTPGQPPQRQLQAEPLTQREPITSIPTPLPDPATETTAASAEVPHSHGDEVDLTHLIIGSDYVSLSGAQAGYLWLCRAMQGAGGVPPVGSWVHGDSTWDMTSKPHVDGDVVWPSSISITLQGDRRVFSGNMLPTHGTGVFPIAHSDDAYQYDPMNISSIEQGSLQLDLPANPSVNALPSCAGGIVGIATTGTPIFAAVDAEGRDALAYHMMDSCWGHPANGHYHYHGYSPCMEDSGSGHSALVGYAFDGFGIYGIRGEDGQPLATADLDECHGHTHTITWDGQQVQMYHYHMTYDFPYSVGCYRGTALQGIEGQILGRP